MAGYSRQSVADIIANAVIKAAPVNAEYNAIRDAFAFSGGHKHDGSSTEGAYVPLIADVDALNKVVVDTSNNRISFYSEVSGAAVEQVRIQDGAIVPVTDNDVDLGTSGLKFKNLYVDGIGEIGSVTILGGTIDNTVIGGTTPAAADFTTMDASGNATVGGTLGVTGNTTIGGTLGVTGVTTLGTANITSADLNSGAIDSTTIGATTPAAGTFTTLTANTSLTAATADINGGTLDGVIIGGTTSAAATVTDLTATGTSTLTTVDINGGAIDGATIGASSAAAGSFTTVSTSGQATLATADINGGTIDGTTIGTTTPAAITGTTVTATSFVGPVTGAVTGNVTGNVTGDLTGDVTGNITSTGSSSFNNVTIDGTLNMNAGTTATITNLTSPTNTNDAATKGYVDTSISNLVDSAPGTLDTLNELAAALGDDPNFSTTITNSIATKLPLAGGTMTGAIAMSTNKITGLGDPTAAQDAMTKAYADATYLALSGGTMTGAIDMGSQKITTTYTPTNAADLTTKTYVDSILGSATAASASAAAAATSESNAATSETNAATSASNAATSEANTATLYDNFDDRYLGAKATAPTVDNDGDALITGALYFNTTTNIMNVYGTSGWQSAGSAVNGTSDRQTYTATSGQTVFAATYDTGYVDVYLNGVKLLAGTDFTATNGTSITLASGAAVNDIVDIVAYGTFVLADHYSKTQSDARYVEVAGDTMTGDLDIQGTLTSDGLTVDGNATINDNFPYILLNESDTTDLNTRISVGSGYFNLNTLDDAYTLAKQRFRLDNATGDISFYEDTGTTAKFFWDASAESLGIGTTSPSSYDGEADNLVVASSDHTGITIASTGTDKRTNLYFSDGTSGSAAYIGGFTYDHSNDSLLTRTGGSERMRIDSSGKVIIGSGVTADAGSLLTVGGAATFTGQNSAHGASRIKIGQDTTAISQIRFYGADTSTAGILQFTGSSSDGTVGAERMRIDSSGQVGIGTTSPSTLMHISGSSASVDGIHYIAENTRGAGGPAGIVMKSNHGDWKMINSQTVADALEFIDGSAGVTRMLINSSGRVGIGTSSPSATLTVSQSANNIFAVERTGVGSGSGQFGINIESNSQTTISYDDGAPLVIGTASNPSTHVGFSERMRIDSSGHLLFAKTSTSSGVAGIRFAGDDPGYAEFTRDGGNPLFLNRETSDGHIIRFAKDNSYVGSIGVVASNNLYVHGDNIGLGIGDDNLYATNASGASNDNAVDLGDPSVRWDDVYATNGTIQTSDRNEKQQIASLTDVEMTAAKAISKLFKTFKWNDSVAEKGDAARTHTGVIAQEVEQAMTDAGLNAGDYAFFISTTWWETQTEVPAVEADEENGVEAQEAYTRTDTYETAEEAPEGATERNRKGIRYPQLLSFIGAATEQRLASIETRLDALEAN